MWVEVAAAAKRSQQAQMEGHVQLTRLVGKLASLREAEEFNVVADEVADRTN